MNAACEKLARPGRENPEFQWNRTGPAATGSRNWSARSFARKFLMVTATGLMLALGGCGGGGDGSTTDAILVPEVPTEPLTMIESSLSSQVLQVGGATTAIARYASGVDQWVLYSMANRLAATKIGMSKGTVSEIRGLPGAIKSITLVPGQPVALLSMGEKGIGIVDITNPAAMVYRGTMSVGYTTPDIELVDGGGNYLKELSAAHDNGVVNDMLIYNDGTDDQLLIANASFGIQKTRLSNLLGGTMGTAVTVDGAQTWTLKYAGENPWGGPLKLKMHGGKLYAALGFLGIGIYDPATMTRQAGYNLYADASTREDWFGYQNEKAVDLLSGSFIDADGMPTWQQAQLELANKHTDTLPAYPWARFDRYGKYYYNAKSLDVIDLPGGKTMAYVAYGLGGLVAVDVTNAQTVPPSYAGYVPAAPAHGPDEPTGSQSVSILSHSGAGKLEEAGAADVRVVADAVGTGHKVYFSDHFAGLVVVRGAEDPGTQWHGPAGKGSYNNDTKPEAYWPDYEFVTSYDMTPVTVGDESLPKFLTDSGGNYDTPVVLVTGEINGHGGALLMMPAMNPAAAGQVDIVQSSGAGGVSFIDIKDVANPGVATADRFAVPVRLASTTEVGAAPAGAPTEVAIGHSEGLAVLGNHLYFADGPHGMSVWRIADAAGTATDDLRLVANTLMDEYPVDGVIPTPHAFTVAFGADPTKAYVMSQSLGMRRVDVSGVGGGLPGSPLLLRVSATDLYEHSTESGGSVGTPKINGQDHAYGVAFHGKYALVADGGNGLTVYDTSVPANAATGAHVVANLGGTVSGKPPLGRSASIKLWTDNSTGRIYAVLAAGAYGVSVVDMTDLLVNGVKPGMTLLKTFEPIKLEEESGLVKVGSADGKSVDVQIAGDRAYVSYDSFGIVAYAMSDLVLPLAQYQPPGQPAGACAAVSPTKVYDKPLDCRPIALGRYKLQADPLHPELALVSGGAQYMTVQYFPANRPLRNAAGTVYTLDTPRVIFYAAYGEAGVIKLDWSNPANPVLMQRQDTAGKAMGTAIANGRVYVADGAGGLVVFK